MKKKRNRLEVRKPENRTEYNSDCDDFMQILRF